MALDVQEFVGRTTSDIVVLVTGEATSPHWSSGCASAAFASRWLPCLQHRALPAVIGQWLRGSDSDQRAGAEPAAAASRAGARQTRTAVRCSGGSTLARLGHPGCRQQPCCLQPSPHVTRHIGHLSHHTTGGYPWQTAIINGRRFRSASSHRRGTSARLAASSRGVKSSGAQVRATSSCGRKRKSPVQDGDTFVDAPPRIKG